jgi:hypothetical protein
MAGGRYSALYNNPDATTKNSPMKQTNCSNTDGVSTAAHTAEQHVRRRRAIWSARTRSHTSQITCNSIDSERAAAANGKLQPAPTEYNLLHACM